MRKIILTIVLMALIWVGYLAWPLYDLYQLAVAVEQRDIAAVTNHVDFARLRATFTDQIVEAYLQKTGTRLSPLLQGAAFSIADPVVAKIVSGEALAEFLHVGWPVAVLPDRPPEAAGLSVEALGSLWALFAASDYGLGRFEVVIPVALARDRAFALTFRLAQWHWRLTRVRLPDPLKALLADEVIKAMRPHQPPP